MREGGEGGDDKRGVAWRQTAEGLAEVMALARMASAAGPEPEQATGAAATTGTAAPTGALLRFEELAGQTFASHAARLAGPFVVVVV